MKIHELNHVAIHVADVERSCAFYRGVLRLETMPRPAFDFPGAWFRLGLNQELHLIGRRGPVVSTDGNNHFALRVDDIAAWEEHLQQAGAEFRPRKQRPDGAWQIFLRDPDGHFIELFTF
jgi:lactoylglutathione lyase